jgi:ethanolamine phosphate phosphodiesterase
MRAGHGTSFEEWIPLRDGPIEFVKGLAAGTYTRLFFSCVRTSRRTTSHHLEEHVRPAILFGHIPLHRAESKMCGPLRERGTIHRGVGHGWQKTLGKQTSSFLLESLRPVIVFRYGVFHPYFCRSKTLSKIRSADDRDYCDVTHKVPGSDKEIHEITVKSFSLARHITQPGFHLLSLNPGQTPSHAHVPCLLPRTSGTFVRLYIPAACLTIIILVFSHVRRARYASRLRLATSSPLPSHADPPKMSPRETQFVPSPYSASSAYSYSYAYSNTPPNSQRGHDRMHIQLPRRDSRQLALGGHRGSTASPHTPLAPAPPLPPPAAVEEDEHDGVRAHYLYIPPASPVPGDLLARRHSGRGGSPAEVATGPPARAWSFTYTFTLRGRRRRVAIHAPAWWPRRSGTRRKDNAVWNAVARDLGRVAGPSLVTWVALVWWYSG